MNIIRFGFCIGLGIIAYKSFNYQDVHILYKITIEKIVKCTPLFKDVVKNFNNLLFDTNVLNYATSDKEINDRLVKLNQSIQEINEAAISKLKFKK